jgi:hypothetical protein
VKLLSPHEYIKFGHMQSSGVIYLLACPVACRYVLRQDKAMKQIWRHCGTNCSDPYTSITEMHVVECRW